MDPYKRSAAIEVITADEVVAGGGWFGALRATGPVLVAVAVNQLRVARVQLDEPATDEVGDCVIAHLLGQSQGPLV
jgi:hypothetical protein